MVSRGDIWLVLPEGSGDAGGGQQPCLILSPPEINDHLGLVIVAPVVTGGRPAGFRVPVDLAGQAAVALLEQLHTIEKRRLTRQVGTIERKSLAAALAILREMFAE